MKTLIIFLIIITILVSLCMLMYNTYNNFNIIKIKMKSADENIKDNLNKKLNLMNKLYTQIKKVVEKKDYLKSFSNLKSKKLDNTELDKELTKYYDLMKKLSEDYSKLRKKDIKDLYNKIDAIEEELTANKRFYNKNNNLLIKEMKGYQKYIAKLFRITTKISYEIKESNEDI